MACMESLSHRKMGVTCPSHHPSCPCLAVAVLFGFGEGKSDDDAER